MDSCVNLLNISNKRFSPAVKALVTFEEWIASPFMERVFDHNKFDSLLSDCSIGDHISTVGN